jgi:DNA-binding transcriptional ArsR family regulator
MMNRRLQYSARLDATFSALSDTTRRGVLERLAAGETSISNLAASFEMTLSGMKKHVHVLEGAGLVSTRKVGRVRRCRLSQRRLNDELSWIARFHQMMASRLDGLGEFLEQTKGDNI